MQILYSGLSLNELGALYIIIITSLHACTH